MSDLNQFAIHQGSSTPLTLNLNSVHLMFLLLGLIQFALVRVFRARKTISSYFSSTSSGLFFHLPQVFNSATCSRHVAANSETLLLQKNNTMSAIGVCRQDMEMVLKSLGMISNGSKEASRLPSRLDADDLFALFEERNPGLDEVRDAFEVFDKNGDGFIDTKDLQKVMSGLGLKQGYENCRRMIGVFDENGDGRLDFQEFVKFMEHSFN